MRHESHQNIPLPHFSSIKKTIQDILSLELSSLQTLSQNIPRYSEELVETILSTKGKVIFSGIGKSGLVARKLAATFSSTGTPSFFLHPTEALHGDLGAIQKDDLFIALSKSSSGNELEHIFAFLKKQKNKTALLCCSKGPLFHKASITIQLPFEREACPLNLAPSSSTTLMIAFGDALALAVSHQRQFSSQDFACFHPAGTLGKKLLLTVNDIMYTGDELPLLSPLCSFEETIVTITQKKLGVGIVVDESNNLMGIITDGDLRRACSKGVSVFTKKAQDIMTLHPKSIDSTALAQDALNYMEAYNITTLTVLNNQKFIGLLHIHDLIKAGL